MKYIVIFIALISLFGCKPKDKPVEPQEKNSNAKPEKEKYLEWSKRIKLGESIVLDRIDPRAVNIQFDSHYKYVGENDGYVCGSVRWTDTISQTQKKNYFYVYLSFASGAVSSNSKPMVFDSSQKYPMEKYQMFCSLE